MAEGLLKFRGGDKSEEELGNEFFDDLESISFFQEQPYLWGDKRFFMHDLVNDLAKSESREFCLQIAGDSVQDISERTRHIWCCLSLKDGTIILKRVCKIKGLHSLLVLGYGDKCFKISNNVQHDLFSILKHLRMLLFNRCNLTELADEISNLKLLCYLDLSHTSIKRLPDSICKLYNLQTLILQSCPLSELPSDFYKLANLCHLYLEQTRIEKMPEHIGRLNHLQTLTTFVVGEQRGSDIKELTKLNHLEGKICLSGLENAIDPMDAAKAILKDKKHLEELNMESCYGYNRREMIIYEALQPNINLKRLTITCYRDTSFPNWLKGCYLPNLVFLKLLRCGLCSKLPPLGQLPSLKELSISRSDGIEFIGEEFYGNNLTNVPFKSLEVLKFDRIHGWQEWLCLEGFPLLKELYIKDCPKLKSALPQHLPSLQKLEITRCKEWKASIPKAANIFELELNGCDSILVNELPSNLKRFILHGNRFVEFSVDQNFFNNAILEELKLDVSGFIECPSLDLRCYNSLRKLYIKGWRSSSLPIAPHLFANLHYLVLYNCQHLESFPVGSLPSNLNRLEIYDCPKLIASRGEWGLLELNSLKEFRVSDDFENMKSFPEESCCHQLFTLFICINVQS